MSVLARAAQAVEEAARGAEARLRHLGLAALATGLALSAAVAPELTSAAAGVVAAALAAARAPRAAVVVLCGLLGGLGAGNARLAAIDAPASQLAPGQGISGRAYLLTPARETRFATTAEIRMAGGRVAGAKLLARFPSRARLPPGARVGAELAVSGSIRPPPPPRAEHFDVRAFHRRRGVAGELEVARVRATGASRGGPAGAVDAMRVRAERALSAGLAEREAALVRGMVLGQDEAIDPLVVDDFRDSGLAHLLAVSGQNVMLLAALTLPLLTVAGLSPTTRIAMTMLLIAVYVPVAGAGPSLQRAGVMGAAGLAALLASRPGSRWFAVLLAACATLALNPRAVGDPGWQLSFAAVAGILLLAPPLRAALSGLPRPLAEGAAVTVAATLATAPLLAHHFGSVSAAGLPANVAALPLVAPIMWLGMLRAAAGQLLPAAGPAAPVAEAANHVLGLALGPLAAALARIAETFAQIPGGQLALPVGSRAGTALAYAVMAACALGVRRAAARLDHQPAAAAWRRVPARRRLALAAAAGAVLALGLARATGPAPPPAALTVSFLDVGQGDATLIPHPDGSTVLFDGGPPEGRVDRLLRGAGVRRLSALVMTHASRDHHGGLLEVVRRYPVELLLDGGDGTADRDFRAVIALARRRGARTLAATAPLSLHAGGISIRVIGPRPRPPGPPPEDPNPRAVAALVSLDGLDLFLSGDAESPSLLGLSLPAVDALKVSHHGSIDPGLPDLLRRLHPSVAAIEVGENSYGHPAPSTLAALRHAGVRTFRTDRDGTVRLAVTGDGATVRAER